MLRPSTARGMPALGMAAMGSVVAAAHGFDGGEHRGGSGGAVHADGIRTPLGQQGRGVRRRGAVEAVALVVDRDHDEHGQIGRGFVRGEQRLAGFVESRHGLDDQEVDAGIGQGAVICSTKAARASSRPVLPERLETDAEGADRAGDPGFAGLLFFEVVGGLAGEADAGGINLGDFAGQSMASQAEAVGAKGVGLENLGAGLQVFLVNGKDEAGVGEVQFVVAAIDEDAASVEHGTHGAIGEHGPVAEDVSKGWHSAFMLSHLSQRGRVAKTGVRASVSAGCFEMRTGDTKSCRKEQKHRRFLFTSFHLGRSQPGPERHLNQPAVPV